MRNVMMAVLLAMGLAGCLGGASQPLSVWMGGRAGWQEGRVTVGKWRVASVWREGVGNPIVYVEGDGHSYTAPDLPSPDPTPRNPVGLALAMADTSGRPVVYMARPCQWVMAEEGVLCRNVHVWTTDRYTEDVAAGYAAAVAEVSKGAPVSLVGYSGGAWVALQVASRLPNVTDVKTVAGNVLPNELNDLHKVPRQNVAPYPDMARLAVLPQVHEVGGNDKTVPEELVRRWVTQLGNPATAKVVVVPGATHATGW